MLIQAGALAQPPGVGISVASTTSDGGDVSVTLSNDTGAPITVNVTVESDGEKNSSGFVVIEPGSSTKVSVPAPPDVESGDVLDVTIEINGIGTVLREVSVA
jgi:P pilus assembly chaperone PapD